MCTETPKVEKDLKQILEVITSCVSEIRSVSVFQPNLLQGELKNVKARRSNEWDLKSTGFRLYRDLCERGIESKVEEVIHARHVDMKSFLEISDASLPLHEMEKERANLVRRVFLPLLSTLASCLRDLDENFESNPPETSTCNGSKNKRPTAPIGLLSLSNYADVACLLELTVCTSILPLLERHVQRSTSDRRKHLSKSIAGRLNAKSLDWGLDTLQYKIGNIGESSLASREKEAGEKIDRASSELSRTLISICSVVLLDRFRPMLLPRLVTDIYAVLFQLERLKNIRETIGFAKRPLQPTALKTVLIHDMAILKTIFLHEKSRDNNPLDSLQTRFATCAPIDFHTMANAYQHLLHSGKHAPLWLKLRLGNLLTILAKSNQEGLIAIIDIFVLAASSLPAEEMTGASARLGRVLCSQRNKLDCSSNDEAYFQELLGQFVTLLERNDIKVQDFSNNHGANDARMTACIITAWSVFENVPPSILKSFFSTRLIEGLALSSDKTSVQSSIRRIHSLLMLPPASGKAVAIFCETLISEMKNDSRKVHSAPSMVTPLGQMIRVGCSTGEELLHCSTVSEATDTVVMTIQLVLETLKTDSLNKDLTIALVQSVATNSFDMLGYYFQKISNQNENDGCSILLQRDEDEYSKSLIDDMQRRAIFVVDRVSTFALPSQQKPSIDSDREKRSNTTKSALPATIFLLVLSIYFESTKRGRSKYLPTFMSSNPDVYKIVSMIIIPSLCDKCAPGTLLEEMSGSDESSLMQIISLILISTANTVDHSSPIDTDLSHEEAEMKICDFSQCCFTSKDPIAVNFNQSNIEIDIASQLSISSVVLSLLVALLELGSKTRLEKEEKILRLLLPYLNMLSAVQESTNSYSSRDQRVDDEISAILKAEIAEMASHAAALIQMRSLDSDQTPQITRGTCIRSNISYIKTLLSSEQPPIRARAIIQLRQIVRCDLSDLKERNDIMTKSKRPLIVEMACSNTLPERLPNPFFEAIEDMLSVCVLSLEDSESYVFSASLQTIVVIVDESSPDYCIPLLMNAVSNGSLVLMHGTLCSSEFSGDSKLSSGQRIKLIEAMNFIIRRRGIAIRSHSHLLMSMALYGTKSLSSGPVNYDTNLQHQVQIQTEAYFEGHGIEGARVANSCSLNRIMRAKTGGPVYNSELDDAVRASLISIISELISTAVLQPKFLARYCPTLIQLGINAMALDSSRLFRRAVALMCSELYACAVREAEQEGSEINFILSLLSSGEDALEATLRFHTSSKTSAKHNTVDSATTARCIEALHFRNILDEKGIISAGNAILELKKKNDSDPIAKLLSQDLKKNLIFSKK